MLGKNPLQVAFDNKLQNQIKPGLGSRASATPISLKIKPASMTIKKKYVLRNPAEF